MSDRECTITAAAVAGMTAASGLRVLVDMPERRRAVTAASPRVQPGSSR